MPYAVQLPSNDAISSTCASSKYSAIFFLNSAVDHRRNLGCEYESEMRLIQLKKMK
jgi:hypothetical protein